MSGYGVGSEEMLSAILEKDRLPTLQLLTNDLRTKLGFVIISNSTFMSISYFKLTVFWKDRTVKKADCLRHLVKATCSALTT
jgi:hypothetical protein